MNPHKWAKEIKAWADGAEIEARSVNNQSNEWFLNSVPLWSNENFEFRIKPQPKEPQYLYVYEHMGCIDITTDKNFATKDMEYLGKIKLEQDE